MINPEHAAMKDLDNLLQQKQVRPTAMRLLVLGYLLKQAAAISLNDLETYFHRSDRITLYRTLKTFEEKGLVHKIDDGTGSVKYACMCISTVESAAQPSACPNPVYRRFPCRRSSGLRR